jgi:CHAD domain-containing protein
MPALARGGNTHPPEPLPKKRLDELAGSLKKQWKCYRKELKRCQRKFSETAIHDFRVETRRLLSGAELLGGFVSAGRLREVQCALKNNLDIFDDLRDAQVQLPALEEFLRRYTLARSFHAHLLKCEQRFAKKTRKRLRRVRTRRLAKLITGYRKAVEARLGGCSARKAAAILLRCVDSAFRRTRRLRNGIDPRDTRTIHQTRVAFKKFRYMMEALAGYLPGVTDEYLERLHDYQTRMGEVQDAQVLLDALDKFLGKKEIRAAARDQFRVELLRRRQQLIRIFLHAADQLLDFWPPETNAGSPRALKRRRTFE